MILQLLRKRERELYRFQAAIDPSAGLGFLASGHVKQRGLQHEL